MATFFQANPFGTPVGQLIERATDGTQASENWAVIMEVCDKINDTDDGPKDAIRAIRKRLTTSIGKNNTSVMYSLTMLETAVKNCGKRFHFQIANKEFLHDLIKIIGPKNDPPQIVQEKILSLIQSWADAFRNQPELKEVERLYVDLKSKGIEFPMTDLDNFAPIHTPAMTAPPVSVSPSAKVFQRPPAPPPATGSPAVRCVDPTKDQLVKLRKDLDIVQGNTRVFGEMLDDLVPGQSDLSDLELLNELNRTCRQMQPRIVELINQVANEEVTSELLKVNDDLNNMFIRFDRFDSYHREPRPPPVNPLATLPTHPPPAYTPRADDGKWADSTDINNLIDLSAEAPSITGGLQLLDLENSNHSHDEFDMFAQSRQSFEANKRTDSVSATYSEQQQPQYQGSLSSAVSSKSPNYGNNLVNDEQEIDEIESWLESQPKESSEPVTSAEFDNFLADRASATDDLPSRTHSDPIASSPSRRLKSAEETESAMFAL